MQSWIKSSADRMPNANIIFKEHQKIIKAHIKNTMVAVNKDDDSQIFGWVNYGDNFINYIFVKGLFRGNGICKKLLESIGKKQYFTHSTKSKIFRDLEYNPYLFKELK